MWRMWMRLFRRRRRVPALICLVFLLLIVYRHQSLVDLFKSVQNEFRDSYQVRRRAWELNWVKRDPSAVLRVQRKQENAVRGSYDTVLLDQQGIQVFNASSIHGVWPNPQFPSDDRILAQMAYVPETVIKERKKPRYKQKLKTVVLWNGFNDVREGQHRLIEDNCPVTECQLTRARGNVDRADAVIFSRYVPRIQKTPGQIWVFSSLESYMNTLSLRWAHGLINWTATYRHDSVLVTPYEKFVPHRNTSIRIARNYAAGKAKLVAWFVSRCYSKSGRGEIAKELSAFIKIDIYGKCSGKICPKRNTKCLDVINRDYKFYLAFENSNCRDYITEKFFTNALQHDAIPIVYGAPRSDYERVAPPKSFIHVDEFPDLSALAAYLKRLDKNDSLYNEYFQWKGMGTFINTHFYCRLCALLWDESVNVWYDDVNKWWRDKDVCLSPKVESWWYYGDFWR